MVTTDHVDGPVRMLEDAAGGPLEVGEIGVVAAPAGVGKSVCLVRIALADLLRGRAVLHVSLTDPVQRVRQRYDELFDAWSARYGFARPDTRRLDMERRRHIHNVLQGPFSADRLRETLTFLAKYVDFRPSRIVVDDYPFSESSEGALVSLREVADEADAAVWLAALTHRHEPVDYPSGLPGVLVPLASQLRAVLLLEPTGGRVHLRLVKDRDRSGPFPVPVDLDPTTMLPVDA